MAQSSTTSIGFSRESLSDPAHDAFVERHGGWILALCFHVMFFALLFLIQRDRPPPAPAQNSIIINLQPEPEAEPVGMLSMATDYDPAGDPESTADADAPQVENFGNPLALENQSIGLGVAAETAPDQPDPNQAAVENPSAAKAESMLLATEPATDSQSYALSEQDLTPDQAAIIEQLRRRAAEMHAANRAQGSRGSPDVDQLLRLAEVDQVGTKTLDKAPQMRQGVDREIDIKDVSLETAQNVLQQYGINIMIMDLTKGPMPKLKEGYINRAVTQSGVMVRPQRLSREKYMAFTYGTIAEKQMAHLEEQALRDRGFDPDKTQVHRVVFGIVPTTDGSFDLGVTKLVAMPVSGAAPQAKTAPNSNAP